MTKGRLYEVLEEISNTRLVKRPTVTGMESPLNWKMLEARKSLGRTLSSYELVLCSFFPRGLFMAVFNEIQNITHGRIKLFGLIESIY